MYKIIVLLFLYTRYNILCSSSNIKGGLKSGKNVSYMSCPHLSECDICNFNLWLENFRDFSYVQFKINISTHSFCVFCCSYA
jgi:hypothetical protein